jgi:hypothetical protein
MGVLKIVLTRFTTAPSGKGYAAKVNLLTIRKEIIYNMTHLDTIP